MRPGLVNERFRRKLGAELKAQLAPVNRPADVARMLNISKQMVDQITDRALYKIAIMMRYG